MLDGKHAVAVDAHPVGRLVRFGPSPHQADGQAGGATSTVLEVVDIAQHEHSAFARVIEVPEIRLAVEKEHGGEALGPKEWQRPDVEVCGDKNAEKRRYDDPRKPPAQPAAGDAHTVAFGVIELRAHRLSCFMNCAIWDASVRSSTKSTADFGTSIRDAGP